MNASSSETTGLQTAFVAIGSNLGDSKANVLLAIERLRPLSELPLLVSSLWFTSPIDCPPGSPLFVNAVAGLQVRSGRAPESLLVQLLAIEKEFGRRPKQVMNEPRPLDLDLIAFGRETRTTAALTLPHPRAHLRRFVLQPLSEIAPDLVLPGQDSSVSQLLGSLPQDSAMRLLG